jgi:hypothetical protein
VDVVENKWTKSVTFRLLSMLMNRHDLQDARGLALDVDENKGLMLFAGLFSATSVDVYEDPAG